MKRSLLIAHSDAMLSDFFRLVCRDFGYVVDTAAGGQECLTKIQRRRPDALVLEETLPWSGREVLAHLRGPGADAMLPVVLICDQRPDCAQDSCQPPVVACLSRPYHLVQFIEAVQEAIRISHPRGPRPAAARGDASRSQLSSQLEKQPC